MDRHRFRLRTFGGVSLDGSGGAPVNGFAAQRKAIALLVLLARAGPQGISRDKILSLLWGDSDTNQARSALGNLLFRVRRALGTEAVLGTADLRIDSAIVTSDVADFDQAVNAGDLEAAAGAYTGPFLDGFFVREAPEFERWATDERARLASTYHTVLEGLAIAAAARGSQSTAVSWWRKRTEAEPLNARVARGYVEALVAAGEREVALSFVATHSALVRSELEVEPDTSLLRLAEQLRHTAAAAPPDDRARLQGNRAESTTIPTDIPARDRSLRQPVWTARRAASIVAATGLIVAVLVAARHVRGDSLDARRVVTASFDNKTGDPTLDEFGEIVAGSITEQLTRAAFASVVDPATALASSRELRGAATADLGTDVRSLAKRTHAGIVVTGSYYRDGDKIVVESRVTDARRNEVLAATQPVRGAASDRGAVLAELGGRVVGAIAVRLDERHRTLVPPGNAPTYEAYQAFVAGVENFTRGKLPDAKPFFEHAYALDTTFVEPLIWEGWTQTGQGDLHRVVDMLEARRARLSDIDRYALDFHRAVLLGNNEEALAASQNAARLAPESEWQHNLAMSLLHLGRIHEAVQAYATIDREHGWLRFFSGFWLSYLQSLHRAGMYREELTVALEARRVLPAIYNLQAREAIALAMNRRWSDLDDRIRTIEGRPGGEVALLLPRLAAELGVHGDTARARSVWDRAVRMYDARAAVDPQLRGLRAQVLYGAGRWKDAASALDSLRVEDPSNVKWVSLRANIEARTGNRARAKAVLDSLLNSFHGQEFDRPRLDACARLAALLGDRERAVSLIERLEWSHYDALASDFDSLRGYPPFERLVAGH